MSEQSRVRVGGRKAMHQLDMILIEGGAHYTTANRIYAEVMAPLLAEAERKGAERGWDECRESFAADFLKPLDEYGMRPVSPNPYRKGVDQ